MQSRRAVLRASAGSVGAGVLAALAGCSDETDADADENDGTNETDSEEIEPTDWVYDPEARDADSIRASLLDVDALFAADGVPNPEDIRSDLTDGYGDAIAVDDLAFVLEVGGSTISIGSIDGSEVAAVADLAADGEYGGFELYANESDDRLLASGDGYLIESETTSANGFDARGELELLIDAYNGDAERFADVSDDFARIHDEIDTGQIVSSGGVAASATGQAIVATGETLSFDGDDTRIERLELYADEGDIDVDAIESDLEASTDITVNRVARDGRLLTIDVTIPSAEFSLN